MADVALSGVTKLGTEFISLCKKHSVAYRHNSGNLELDEANKLIDEMKGKIEQWEYDSLVSRFIK
jgi:hypothetical protein